MRAHTTIRTGMFLNCDGKALYDDDEANQYAGPTEHQDNVFQAICKLHELKDLKDRNKRLQKVKQLRSVCTAQHCALASSRNRTCFSVRACVGYCSIHTCERCRVQAQIYAPGGDHAAYVERS